MTLKHLNSIKWLGFVKLSLCLLHLAGCASSETADLASVDQNEVYQHYWADYYEAQQELCLGAQLRFHSSKGTTLRLSGDAKLSVNKAPLEELGTALILGTRYGRTWRNTPLAAAGEVLTFEWIDTQGRASRQTLHIRPLLAGPLPTRQPNGQPLTLRWMNPLDADEEVRIILSDSSGTQLDAYTTALGDTLLEINAERLKMLQPGTIQVQIQRVHQPPLQQPRNPGGNARGTWHGTPQSFELMAGES